MSFGAWHLITKVNVLSATMRLILGGLAFGVLFLAFVISEQLFKTKLFSSMNAESGRKLFLYLWLVPVFVSIVLALKRVLKRNRAHDGK